MKSALPPSSHSVGRLTGFVLGLVVFVCISLIGCAGYLKYELDRAEAALMSPESNLSADQDATEKLRHSLGYGGFLGLAQNYISTRDASTLNDMKTEIKAADDLILQLPEKTPAEARHDLQSIVTMFDDAMQKARKASTDNTAPPLAASDLMPLYAALPVLDSRLSIAANSNKAEAHNQLQFWAMLLTLASWCSLIIAAAMSVGIYLSLRDRNSAPLRALAQSIRNMASGDMRTSIWGMERSDMIGDLARAVDQARYTFSQLPDLSVMSEQGPLRLRFEGKARSMFEAMMQVITQNSEHVRNHVISLADAISRQNEAITLISSRVEAVLHNVEKRGLDGDRQIKQVIHSLVSSAQSLKNAQEHSADQLNRLIPFLQERAQGIAEIAQITGKQISQILQNMTSTERSLKISAEESDIAIKKLSSTADDLGGRLFGAVNLLQASGKVLSETTEKTQGRLNEAIAKLEQNITTAALTSFSAENSAETPTGEFALAPRLETVIHAFESAQRRLEERILQQNEATRIHIDLLSTQNESLLSQAVTTAHTLSAAAENMRKEHNHFDEMMEHMTLKLEAFNRRLEDQPSSDLVPADGKMTAVVYEELQELTRQIESMAGQVASLNQITKQSTSLESLSERILGAISNGFGTTHQAVEHIGQELLGLLQTTRAEIGKLQKEDTGNALVPISDKILGRISDGFNATDRTIHLLENRLVELSQKIHQVPQSNVSETLSDRLETVVKLIHETHDGVTLLSSAIKGIDAKPSKELVQDVQQRWFQMAAQIEATRSDLMQAIIQQVDRLEAGIKKGAPAASVPPASPETTADTQRQIEQQTLILTELVATLGVLDTHMQQLKSEVRAVRS